jgi:glycosyltransferase involved in cell wall biosynthesis
MPIEKDPQFWERHGMQRPEGPVIACVGQIIRRKRPVEIFDSLAPVLQSRKDVTLVFAGETFEPEVERTLRYHISAEGLADRVLLPGVIRPREELRQLYSWADIHVLNTVWESQCMVLYESLAAGVPTLIPAIPELTSAFPNLPAHRNGDELKHNVMTLLDDPDFRTRLVRSSKPYLEWAYNESHDRTIHRLCTEWLNGAIDPAAP